MKFSYPQIYLQEVPGEISLGISISGCSLKCKGCHSIETWNTNFGEELTLPILDALVKKYKHITCVLFYGGEWDSNIKEYLKYIQEQNLKTALYSGENSIREELLQYLDYYKIGPYIQELGGLSSKISNQKLYRIQNKSNELIDITYMLQK